LFVDPMTRDDLEPLAVQFVRFHQDIHYRFTYQHTAHALVAVFLGEDVIDIGRRMNAVRRIRVAPCIQAQEASRRTEGDAITLNVAAL
jgi:hypothetical protein